MARLLPRLPPHDEARRGSWFLCSPSAAATRRRTIARCRSTFVKLVRRARDPGELRGRRRLRMARREVGMSDRRRLSRRRLRRARCLRHSSPTRRACEADARCAWAGVRPESASIDLCPVGQSCDAGGYCHARDAYGRRLHLRAADRVSRERRLSRGRMRLLEHGRAAAAGRAPAPARSARPARPARPAPATAARGGSACAVAAAGPAPAPARRARPVRAVRPATARAAPATSGSATVGRRAVADAGRIVDRRHRPRARATATPGRARRTARALVAGSSSASSASPRRARAARVFR